MAGGRRVSPAELLALQGEQERIRNVCIIAHVDHGKTTLSDSLVSSNGIISAKLAGKLRFLDSTEEEQQRGITMKSSAISLLHTKEERKGRLKQQQGQQPRSGEAEGGGTASEGATTPLPPPPPTQTNGSAQPPKPEGGGGGPAAVEVEVKDYLINLIDSPGHIDFSSDVSTATRLSDGAIVVVDVLEGVCTQTHAVLRQAWAERMKPCLVLNKLDRLILELRLTPLEAYWHLQRVLERLNAISSSLITNETFRLDETEDFADDLEKEWLFSPDRGNVVFASSLYCWAFSVGTFAKIWAKKLGLKRVLLQRHLWGDFVFNPKAQTVTRWTAESKAKPMFVAMVLDPIWQLYDTAVVTPDLDKVAKMIKRLDLEVPARELNAKDTRGTAQSIFRRWLPLADAVLDMVVEVVPDPMAAQRRRIPALWPEHQEEEMLAQQQQQQDGAPPATNGHGGEEGQAGGMGELLAGMASVRSSLSCCSNGPDAPVVVFVSKMISVRNAELADSPAFSHEGESFVGFARVFSGVLRPNTQMHVLGPKYHPLRRRAASHCRAVPEDTRLCLYMMMGTSLTPVPHVPAGNLVAILGLDGLVLKSATLTSTLACPALTAMTLQAKPIVRVAVEVVRQQDMAALERGLAKLYQADPAVEVSVQETGEHVIMALGELHLEQCLKDLRERYAKVELRASAPLVTFKESVATDVAPSTGAGEDAGTPDRPPQLTLPPWSEEEGAATAAGGVCVLETPSKDCRLTVRCLPLPDSLARMLEAEPTEVRVLMKSLQAERDEAVAGEGAGPSGAAAVEEDLPALRSEAEAAMVLQRRKMSTLSQDGTGTALPFRQAVEEEWTKAWQDTRPQLAQAGLAALLAFGPRNSGPNTLVKSPAFRVRVLAVERKRRGEEAEGGGAEGEEEEVEERDVPLGGEQGAKALEEKVWRCLGNSIATGFQMATASGPLAEEQVYGVCFVVEEVALLLREGGLEGQEAVGEWLTSRLGSLTGQVMSSCKSACRAAFLSSPVRLVEALFKCDLQCDRVQLGKLYGVLSKRRGRVVEEDIIEGTDLFLIRALLPVAESFGFATELLKKTSGAATTPQLAFSHWERMELDPFWRPRNEEDREEFGESVYEVNTTRKYIDDTRRRKGLQLGEKIVIHAEKQRTLKKNK